MSEKIYAAMGQTIQAIVKQFGEGIFMDSNRFVKALDGLSASTTDEKKVKNMLRIAICDLKAFARLKEKCDKQAITAIAKEMEEEYMIPLEASTRVVSCIAVFTGYRGAVGVSAPAQAAGSKTVHFGGYNWRVLDIQNGKILLLSDKVLEKRQYHEELTSTNWAACSLRRYLNNEFYNTFSEAEKARILEVTTYTPNNPWFGTEGSKAVVEKIFLLSIEEMVKYFGDSGLLYNKESNINVINDRFNAARATVDINDAATWWWLRSSGDDSEFAAYICTDGVIHISGSLVIIGEKDGAGGGVRPALWMNLNG